MLSSCKSLMNRGRRHPLQKIHLYKSNYTYRSATSKYEEKYRSYLSTVLILTPGKFEITSLQTYAHLFGGLARPDCRFIQPMQTKNTLGDPSFNM
jgi:hypothetical protein